MHLALSVEGHWLGFPRKGKIINGFPCSLYLSTGSNCLWVNISNWLKNTQTQQKIKIQNDSKANIIKAMICIYLHFSGVTILSLPVPATNETSSVHIA